MSNPTNKLATDSFAGLPASIPTLPIGRSNPVTTGRKRPLLTAHAKKKQRTDKAISDLYYELLQGEGAMKTAVLDLVCRKFKLRTHRGVRQAIKRYKATLQAVVTEFNRSGGPSNP